MISKKGQNSIFVIATLGVYFGLVLVGATPQVLAQAAMTRHFDVRDEIEFTDNLDKKPDDETKASSQAVEDYITLVRSMVGDVARLADSGASSKEQRFSYAQIAYLPCSPDGLPSSTLYRQVREKSAEDERALVRSLIPSGTWLSLSDCTVQKAAGGKDSKRAETAVSLNSSSLLYTAGITRNSSASAEQLAASLTAALELYRSTDTAVDTLISNTRLTVAENQVVIITNLPRASLDPLLASLAK